MMNRIPKTIVCCIFIGLMVIIPLINFTNAQDTKTIINSHITTSLKGTYTIHAPIKINKDSDFNSTNGVISGTGIKTDPFLISGWEINVKTNESQIFINNTDKYFTIKDCYIHGCNYPNNTMGITFLDVRNGTIDNNTISGKYYRAIYMISINKDVYNNFIINNTIFQNQVGVWFHATTWGTPGVYYNYVNGNKIFNNTNEGIVIGTSTSSYVLNNSVEFNGKYGIILHNTKYDYVEFNKIYNNQGGMELDATSTNNKIFSNDFVNNGGSSVYQATAADYGNDWNTGSSGNYWSDYQTRYPFAVTVGNVWNYSYSIYGAGTNKDYYPLANPVNETPAEPTLFHPNNGIRTIGNVVNLTWFASYGPGPIIYDVYLDSHNPPTKKVVIGLNVTYFKTSTIDGTKYYWRVRAVNPYTKVNSTVWNFTENAKPFPPTVPITPLNGAKGIIYGAMNVTWNFSAPDIDGDKVTYYWYVDNKSSMNPPYIANGTTTDNFSTNFITLPNTTYYWKVRANDSYEWSNWSNNGVPWNFTTMKQDTSPRITIFTPSGGEVWHNSTVQEITWNATGDTQLPQNPIKLYYSTDSGTGWNLLNNSYPNNGSYYWKIPDHINSTQCLVNVECTDFFSSTTNKTSNIFSITNWTAPAVDYPPKVYIIRPQSGDILYGGIWMGIRLWEWIRWNATDDNPLSNKSINITFSLDGVNWELIAGNISNTGRFNWTVPIEKTVNAVIKVAVTDSAGQQAFNVTKKFAIIIDNTSFLDMWVFPFNITIPIGSTQQFYACVYFNYNGTVIPNPKFMWIVNETIGSIDQNGLFTADNVGTGYVTAIYKGEMRQAIVNVVSVPRILYEIKFVDQYTRNIVQNASLRVGDQAFMFLQGFDSSGNGLGGIDYEINVTGEVGLVNPMKTQGFFIFTATKSGIEHIYGRNGTIEGSARVVVSNMKVTFENPPNNVTWLANSTYVLNWNISGAFGATVSELRLVEVYVIPYKNGTEILMDIPVINITGNTTYTWHIPAINCNNCTLEVEVKDSEGFDEWALSGRFAITFDRPPIITSTPITTATVGTEWTYNVVVNDTEVQWGDILTFSLEKAPQGMDINSSSGLITWTPTDAGNFSVTVRVTDSVGLYNNQTFSIKVTGSNVAGSGAGLDFGWLMIGSFILIFLVVCILIIIETRKRKAKKQEVAGKDEQEERRKTVYDYIAQHPDDDSESIAAALKLPENEFNTLAQTLVSGGYITLRKDGKQKRYSVKKPLEKEAVPAPVIAKEEKKEEFKPKAEELKILVTPPPVAPIAETPQDLRCPTCNAKVTEEMEKCPECDEELKKAETPPIAEPKPEMPKPAQNVTPIPAVAQTSDEKKGKNGLKRGDKILMLLLRNDRYREMGDVPYEMTQKGMCEHFNVEQNVMSKTLKRKEDQGYIIKVKKHIIGKAWRMDAYFLTHEGEIEAKKLLKMKEERDEKRGIGKD